MKRFKTLQSIGLGLLLPACLFASDEAAVESQLAKTIAARLGLPEASVKLRQVSLRGLEIESDDSFELILQQPVATPGRIYFTLLLHRGTGYAREVQGSAVLGLMLTAWTAKKNIRHQQQLTADCLQREKRLFWQRPDLLTWAAGEQTALQARGYISAGSVLMNSMIEPCKSIDRKSDIRLSIISGGTEVETSATTLEDGNPGETIAVFCNSTGKKMQAELVSETQAIIRMEP